MTSTQRLLFDNLPEQGSKSADSTVRKGAYSLSGMKWPVVDIAVTVLQTPTAKSAILIKTERAEPVWLPKSVCRWDGEGEQVIQVEAWKAREKGLI